jgi:uncharacterized membrane protein YkvA (DUF1232 family)
MKVTALDHNLNSGRPLSLWRLAWRLPSLLRLFSRLFRDARVGRLPKALMVASVLYVLLPFDFLSDLLPLIGVVDDLALLLLAARLFVGMVPREVVDEHLRALERG